MIRGIIMVAILLALGCSESSGDGTCDRYIVLSKVMHRVDPRYWSVPKDCPSDETIARQGWSQASLADCVTYLELQCKDADIDVCLNDGKDCLCKVGFGDAERKVCAPF